MLGSKLVCEEVLFIILLCIGLLRFGLKAILLYEIGLLYGPLLDHCHQTRRLTRSNYHKIILSGLYIINRDECMMLNHLNPFADFFVLLGALILNPLLFFSLLVCI